MAGSDLGIHMSSRKSCNRILKHQLYCQPSNNIYKFRYLFIKEDCASGACLLNAVLVVMPEHRCKNQEIKQNALSLLLLITVSIILLLIFLISPSDDEEVLLPSRQWSFPHETTMVSLKERVQISPSYFDFFLSSGHLEFLLPLKHNQWLW